MSADQRSRKPSFRGYSQPMIFSHSESSKLAKCSAPCHRVTKDEKEIILFFSSFTGHCGSYVPEIIFPLFYQGYYSVKAKFFNIL